jgi:Flp pilus assembly protein TadG
MRRRRHQTGERGAVAVEFALLLPLLLMIVFGFIDFGRAFHTQITLTQAAREGVRLAALRQPDVTARTQAAAQPLTGVGVIVTNCAAGSTADAVVKTTYTFSFITPIGAVAGMFGSSFGSSLSMSGRAVMRCQG